MCRFVPVALFLTLVAIALAPAGTASAHVPTSQRETVQVGPYPVEVWFSEWPIQAERSVDITFNPAGGIADKTATIALIAPGGDSFRGRAFPLGRHPRQRDRWGLDLFAFPEPGTWAIELKVDGPQGIGTATIGPFTVGPQPGPPSAPMWLIGLLPILFLAWLLARAWLRVRPARTADARSWA